MVSLKSVEKQLKSIDFNGSSWGKAEVRELPGILLDNEQIYECVNGSYEGGFALLVGTNLRLLLVDKKPLKYLTVEDLRFDMINQIDYSHRLMGAHINVSAGSKNLKFFSVNQKRLRKLINHIQHRMAEIKTEQSSSAETQQQHLERINQQLQSYLMAQHQQQEELRRKLEASQQEGKTSEVAPTLIMPVKPAPELADFLFAQSLMQQYQASTGLQAPALATLASPVLTTAPIQAVPAVSNPMIQEQFAAVQPAAPAKAISHPPSVGSISTDAESLVEEGRREIFGSKALASMKPLQTPLNLLRIEVHPLRIAYAKLPALLRLRKFNRQSAGMYTAPSVPPLPGSTQIAGA